MDMNIQVHGKSGDIFCTKGLQELQCVLLIQVSDIYGITWEVGRTFVFRLVGLMAVTLKIAVF